MVVDASILIAILKKEPGHEAWYEKLIAAPVKYISAVSLLEVAIVWFARTRDERQVEVLYSWILNTLRIEVVPFRLDAAKQATNVFINFGKGIHSPGLNMGDCAVYALAMELGLPVFSSTEEFKEAKLKVVK